MIRNLNWCQVPRRLSMRPLQAATAFHHAKPIIVGSSSVERQRFWARSKATTTHTDHYENHAEEMKNAKDRAAKHKYMMAHPIWTEEETSSIKITHLPPKEFVDRLAYGSVLTLRTAFDIASGYKFGVRNEAHWIRRIVFLESVAGVPGFVAGAIRHLQSLRLMKRDGGFIHTLLEEGENERMHLLTAIKVMQPGLLFRLGVLATQGVFTNLFAIGYFISPRFCHRFVGYLEEEAVKTYTHCLEEIDNGNMAVWKTKPAPQIAIEYWNLDANATMRDVIAVIRADEAHHRLVNHTFSDLTRDKVEENPFGAGR
eukprot:Colp12_sorted_trinity150504_noHs@34761